MKKITLFVITCAIIIGISAFDLSYSTGIAFRTNSPYDVALGPANGGTCSNCHSGGATIPTATITATPAFSNNTYVAGTTYTLTVAASGSYPKYGFGLEILNSNTSTAADAGTFGAVISNCKKMTAAGKPTNIVHTVATGTANAAAFVFTWTAPTNGAVYIYCAVNGVNNNTTTAGDNSTTTSLTLTESTAAVAEVEEKLTNVSIFPNPANEYATVSYTLKENSTVTIELYDISGKNVGTLDTKNQQAGQHTQAISLSELNLKSGIYSATVKTGNNSITKRLIID